MDKECWIVKSVLNDRLYTFTELVSREQAEASLASARVHMPEYAWEIAQLVVPKTVDVAELAKRVDELSARIDSIGLGFAGDTKRLDKRIDETQMRVLELSGDLSEDDVPAKPAQPRMVRAEANAVVR